MQKANINTTGEPSEIFVSAEVIAKRYSVTSRAVLLWAAQGIIPSIRIGNKTVRFNVIAVSAALEGGAA
ncbi:MAG: hypothetical protein CAK88_08925 [Verrucomicrobiia bacterium AMD-G2]|jgi:hypothetical protein|nr:MAG: hypothetical protein CAK88_08925 [Verrucomicrobiae bacterium AMD-G2]